MSVRGRVYVRTLGCPKNEADGAALIRHLERQGWMVVDDPANADAEVINTCGFIEATKLESLEAVWEGVARKEALNGQGALRRLIVTGCLAQRYPTAVAKDIPFLDAVIGFNRPDLVARALTMPLPSGAPACWVDKPDVVYREDESPWVADAGSPAPLSVYVKIGDGCDNGCRFCAIPSIRGRLRSRPLVAIRDEVAALVDRGTREIILVSQDSTSWGIDFHDGTDLGTLLEALDALPGDLWIRLMYAHPAFLTERHIAVFGACEKIVSYLDMPMQRASDHMLRLMNRHTTRAATQQKIDALRRVRPDLALRTTFIVGHPGETGADFEELVAFAADNSFERMGVFAYSTEEGTASTQLRPLVPPRVARERVARLTEVFDRWSAMQSVDKVGRTLPCLLERRDGTGSWVGRSIHDAPEIDGHVTVAAAHVTGPGIYHVEIDSAQGVDLAGRIVHSRGAASLRDHPPGRPA
ncbi:MAG: 30S ribosomal protein S12 methylthiotransferase RimO [Candidatus Zixiibacteriota bacterium]